MKEKLLVIAAALIVLFFLFQLVRGYILARRPWRARRPKTEPELEEMLRKADSPVTARTVLKDIDGKAVQHDARARASYYSVAGEISLHKLKRPNVAIRYYLRALRNNPRCESAFDRLSEILLAQKRYRRFKRACWFLLSRMDEDDTGTRMWKKCWTGLATVYAASPTTTNRADAIRKMLAGVARDVEDDELAELDLLDEDDRDGCCQEQHPCGGENPRSGS
jgi:tetratricopeptide (TPR) repeat protein